MALVSHGGARLGTLGAAVPGGGATPSPMLTQACDLASPDAVELCIVHGLPAAEALA